MRLSRDYRTLSLSTNQTSMSGPPSARGAVESSDSIRLLSIHKHSKKKAANDAQLLMNRIALLQKEEERARRKIEKTKERANVILAIRDSNERKIEQFIQAAEEEKQHTEVLHQQHAATEEETRVLKDRQIKKMLSRKKEAVRDSRIMKHKLRNDVIKMKEDEIRRKQERHEELKRQEMEAKQRKEEKKREQERRIKEHFELKARMEEAEVRRAESLVRALEQKEREWIERLRATQDTQERTFVELEATLQQGSPGSKKGGPATKDSTRPLSTDPQSEMFGKRRSEGFAVGERPEEAEGASGMKRSSSQRAHHKNSKKH